MTFNAEIKDFFPVSVLPRANLVKLLGIMTSAMLLVSHSVFNIYSSNRNNK